MGEVYYYCDMPYKELKLEKRWPNQVWFTSHIEYRSSYVVLLHLEWGEWGCLCVLYKNGCFYIHYTKLSDLWCEYMEYMRSVICLLEYVC